MSIEEANARALLLEMQTRLAESPHTALGLSPNASPQEIRSAFLQLTKTFHPARFGRMATDIQRLSNEVFLLLRAAHDTLAKPKPAGRAGSTTAVPTTKAVTRPFGVPITPTTRPGVPTTGKPVGETPTPPARQSGQIPPVRTGHTPPPVLTRPSSPPASTAPPTRPSSPTPGIPMRPTPPPARQTPPTGITFSSGGAPRPAGPAPGTQPVQKSGGSSSSGQALDRELAPILELMGMGMWDVAQAAIDALAAKTPQNNRYAALAYYTRGRRAQAEGDRRIAQIEFAEALKLDPDLEPAKIANAELFARRK
jgi:hypothetical protein